MALRLCGLSFWGWFIYFLGSVGYFVVDSMAAMSLNLDDQTWDIAYTTLALVFLVNSLVYQVEWFLDSEAPRVLDTSFWANATNVFASLVLVVSAGIFLVYPRDAGGGSLYKERAIVQSAFNLTAVMLYALDSLLFGTSYYNSRLAMTRTERADSPVLREPYFWSELLCIMASFGYQVLSCVCVLFCLLSAEAGDGRGAAHLHLESRAGSSRLSSVAGWGGKKIMRDW